MNVGNSFSAVNLLPLEQITDQRGSLLALEQYQNIPFEIKRVYCIYGVAPNAQRGFHAHKQLEQVVVCLSGSVTIDVEFSNGKQRYTLDSPGQGLHLKGLVWREMKAFSEGAVLMVIASDYYCEDDYIRDYEDFQHRLLRFSEEQV